VDDGLLTRDVAVMHEDAVARLAQSHDFARVGAGARQRARAFLVEALAPLESAQRAMHETNRELARRNAALTAAASRENRRLTREIQRRKAGEAEVKKGQREYRALFLESQVIQKKLRLLTRQILVAQEEERKEISRELHDGVVQTLVGINVELSTLSKGAAIGLQGLRAKIARTRRLVENSVKAVHRFARELRPPGLDDLGLIPALHAYTQSLAERKRINIQMTAFGGVEALGPAKRTALFRVAQEALTNVARHAQATQVRMSITEIAGTIRMEIGNNGKTFDVRKALLAKNPKRLGLIGMRERIEMVGGRFAVESTPGKGTTVTAEIPFPEMKRKR
jgi:signal transduction histidine kinase